MTAASRADTVAERVVVRYAPATDTVRSELETDRYAAFLRTAEAGPVAPGDEWDHFVSRGCGAVRDVVLTVDSVAGGDRVGETTAFAFVPAEAPDPDHSTARDHSTPGGDADG